MSGRRRSQLEIMLNVLVLIHNGEEKTSQIMSGAGITSSQFKKIKKILSEKEYITVTNVNTNKGRRRDKRTKELYGVTQRGLNVLRYYWKTGEILEEPPKVK